jgi:hypothetical protein
MTVERDPLLALLTAGAAPALPDRLDQRTLRRVRAHLPRPREGAIGSRRHSFSIPAVAVPALLASAGFVLVVDACFRVARIFGAS